MKLQQATLYAIWSVTELAARPGQSVPAAELASAYGMSLHHLAKVLRVLATAGLVTSTRGPGGGCTLVANPNRLTLYDIISLFEPALFTEAAAPGNGLAHEIAQMLGEIDRITAATLHSVTIRTLLAHAARRVGKPAADGAGSLR